jgi:hypothetical protein
VKGVDRFRCRENVLDFSDNLRSAVLLLPVIYGSRLPKTALATTGAFDQNAAAEPVRDVLARDHEDILKGCSRPEAFREGPKAREGLKDRDRFVAQLNSVHLGYSQIEKLGSLRRRYHERVSHAIQQARRCSRRCRRFDHWVPRAADPNCLGKLLLRYTLSDSWRETRVSAEIAHLRVDPLSKEFEKERKLGTWLRAFENRLSSINRCHSCRPGTTQVINVPGMHAIAPAIVGGAL